MFVQAQQGNGGGGQMFMQVHCADSPIAKECSP
jgi:hypothetical protein